MLKHFFFFDSANNISIAHLDCSQGLFVNHAITSLSFSSVLNLLYLKSAQVV